MVLVSLCMDQRDAFTVSTLNLPPTGATFAKKTSHTQKTRLHITSEILKSINGFLTMETHSYDKILTWAALFTPSVVFQD